MSAWFKKIDDAMYQAEQVLIVCALSVMTIVVFVQVTLRVLHMRGFPWAEELARYLMIWSGFLGASIATRQRRHLKIDILTRFLPDGQVKTLILRLAALISAGFCFFLTFVGYEFVANSFKGGRVSSSMGVPMWIIQAGIPLTSAIIACRFVGQACGDVKESSEIDHFFERPPES